MRILAMTPQPRRAARPCWMGESLIGEYILNVAMTHSERLLPAIERIMADAGWTGKDLEGIAVARDRAPLPAFASG